MKQLLKGLAVSVRVNAWRKVSDVLLKILESGDVPHSLLPIMGGISPLFLLRVNGRLDLTVDDHMISKLEENQLIAPLLMDAESLIAATSKVDEADGVFAHIDTFPLPPPALEAAKSLLKYLGDEINVTATQI